MTRRKPEAAVRTTGRKQKLADVDTATIEVVKKKQREKRIPKLGRYCKPSTLPPNQVLLATIMARRRKMVFCGDEELN